MQALDRHAVRVLDHGCDVIIVGSDQEVPLLIKSLSRNALSINNLPFESRAELARGDPMAQEASPSIWFFYRETAWQEIAALTANQRIADGVRRGEYAETQKGALRVSIRRSGAKAIVEVTSSYGAMRSICLPLTSNSEKYLKHLMALNRCSPRYAATFLKLVL